MFANMKLGAKIGTGFAGLMGIAVLLGGMAVWSMRGVKSDSDMLAHEYVPEVEVATDLDRFARATMYEIRGYHFSEEDQYLEKGRKNLEEVKAHLREAEALAAKSPHLVKLKEGIGTVEKAVKEYEALTEQTVARNRAIAEDRQALDKDAQEFMENCFAFLSSQQQEQESEFRQGAEAARLEERAKKVTLVNDVIDLGNAVRLATWKSQAQRDPKVIQDGMKNFPEMEKKLGDLKAITRKEEDLREIDKTREAAKAYQAAMTDLLANWQAREEIAGKRLAAADEVLTQAGAMAARGVEETLRLSGEAAASLSKASTTTIVGLLLAVAVGVSLAVFITRSITLPVNRVIDALRSGADQVAAASGQVAQASQQMAEGASEQASSLEEISSSLEEMSSMTRQNADSASQADQLMKEAGSVVQRANESMGGLTRAMQEVSTASEETSKIIRTIDEIAFQTNLLALNAAVEAARAGEAGAGFAVVADEVRNLAMRAAEAAKNTAGLIEDTVKKVKEGTGLVEKTNQDFGEVGQSATRVAGLVGEIAAASREQAQGVNQVNTAVSQMDKVTQSNAANAEESASASEELSAQAQQMKAVVFELVNIVGSGGSGDAPRREMAIGRTARTLRQAVTSLGNAGLSRAKGGGPVSIKPEEAIPLDTAPGEKGRGRGAADLSAF